MITKDGRNLALYSMGLVMKLAIKSIGAALILCLCAATYSGCTLLSPSRRAWKETPHTIEAYEQFIAAYPDSEYAKYARTRLARLHRKREREQRQREWQAAETENTFSAYGAYLKKHPLPVNFKEVWNRLSAAFEREQKSRVQTDWARAQELDTVESYEKYLVKHKGSPFIADARRRLQDIGKDPYLEALWTATREDRLEEKAKNKRKHFHAITVLPVASKDPKTRLVFKNQEQMYMEITGRRIKKLPADYELLKLRYARPFQVCVLFFDPDRFESPNAFWEHLKPAMLELIDAVSKAMGYDSKELWLLLESPASLIPEKERTKTFYEYLLLLAKEETGAGSVLEVEEQETLEETEAVRGLVDDLSTRLRENSTAVMNHAAAALLLVNNSRATGALQAAGPIAVDPLIAAMNHKDTEVRTRAAWVLRKMGTYAVPTLIDALPKSKRRWTVISILGDLGDPRAIPPLAALLIDWHSGPRAASALKSLGWTPSSEKEVVHLAVARRNRKDLLADWSRTKKILMAEIGSYERGRIQGAVYAFIAIGKKEILPDLIAALERRGTKTMAEVYLNSGSGELDKAARDWASKRGYHIMTGPGASAVSWGRF